MSKILQVEIFHLKVIEWLLSFLSNYIVLYWKPLKVNDKRNDKKFI
uniref:Uncharacterized protein n=1 Tax=Tetranychus urticae TaxID=32264 RepID=T1KLK6_TETUR